MHWVDPEENVSQRTDRQTDGHKNRTDFIGPLPQRPLPSYFSEIQA